MCCNACKDCKFELFELRRQMDLIDRADWIRNQLMKLDPCASFRSIVCNPYYRYELERIFQCPFHRIKREYSNLINERNRICHRYSQAGFY